MTDEETPMLKKLRSRWMRWLGQKRRNYGGVELLDSNYLGWKYKVLKNHNIELSSCKDPWKIAIGVACIHELRTLDCICIDMRKD